MTKSQVDLMTAMAALLLGAVSLYATSRLTDPLGVDPMGPKAFPAILAVVMLLCGAWLALQTVRRRMSAAAPPGAEPSALTGHPVAVGVVAVGLLFYYVLYTRLGFVISTIIFLLMFLSFFNRGRHVLNVSIAVVFPVVLDLIFVKVLGASPARGILPF